MKIHVNKMTFTEKESKVVRSATCHLVEGGWSKLVADVGNSVFLGQDKVQLQKVTLTTEDGLKLTFKKLGDSSRRLAAWLSREDPSIQGVEILLETTSKGLDQKHVGRELELELAQRPLPMRVEEH